MKILGKRVLIKKTTEDEKLREKVSKVGLIIPEKEGERMPVETGKVIEIGEIDFPDLKGKEVIYNAWAGDEVEIEKNKYILVHIDDVLIVL